MSEKLALGKGYTLVILTLMSWKRLKRTTLVDTKFLKVYADKVELPNGEIIDDYTVVEKPDYIIVIAVDELGNLITLVNINML